MIKITVAVVILCTFRSIFRVHCELWTQYKSQEKYADQMCDTNFVENKFFVANKLRCFATCSVQLKRNSLIYDRNSKICYEIKEGYKARDCNMELIGARLYKRDICPTGWEMVYGSCFTITSDEHIAYRNVSLAKCKHYSENAHLPYLKTMDHYTNVRRWLRNDKYLLDPIWFGATNDKRWLWSDGSPVTLSQWDTDREPTYEGVSLCMTGSATYKIASQPCESPLKNTGNRGLCELNIP